MLATGCTWSAIAIVLVVMVSVYFYMMLKEKHSTMAFWEALIGAALTGMLLGNCLIPQMLHHFARGGTPKIGGIFVGGGFDGGCSCEGGGDSADDPDALTGGLRDLLE